MSKAKLERAYAKLPIRFEENRGQTSRRVKFLSRGPGYGLFLTPRGAVLSLRKPAGVKRASGSAAGRTEGSGKNAAAVIRMRMVGANESPVLTGAGRLRARTNYLIGNDRSKWHRGISNYARVRYSQVYPGIDLVYHGKRGKLEYDFVVAPGADPKRIGLDYQGARLSLDRRGDLLLRTAAGTIRQERPFVYQTVGGARRQIPARYVRQGERRVTFELGRYDRRRPLVIDPALVYSTYLGGSGNSPCGCAPTDLAHSIAVDASGSAYITGETNSFDFPTKAGYESDCTATGRFCFDAFVTKLTPEGALAYSTYLGGSGSDVGYGVAVDSAGRAYVTGENGSGAGGPTGGGFPTTEADGSCSGQLFITRLSADGARLDYSRCPAGEAGGTAIAVGPDSSAYVTGWAEAGLETTPGAYVFDCLLGGPCEPDAFVTKVSADGSKLAYSTYLGGQGAELGYGIAVDSSGSAYVTGRTQSTDFPTAKAHQPQYGGGDNDAFVTRLSPSGSSLLYSTYLGGSDSERITQGDGYGTGDETIRSERLGFGGIALDPSGSASVTGTTCSENFPKLNALQEEKAGGCDAFVTKFEPGGAALAYSTYLGGSGDDRSYGIAVDASGAAHVAGSTRSPDFPTTLPAAARALGRDAFLTKLTSAGSAVEFSTYLGATGSESASGVAVDPGGNAYVAGSTSSYDFPTLNPAQPENRRGSLYGKNAIVLKFAPSPAGGPVVTGINPPSGPLSGGRTVTITGKGFTGASAVHFGDIPAVSHSFKSDTEMTAVAPPHSAGQPAVTVTTPAGISPPNPIARFSYGEGSWQATDPLQTARSSGVGVTPLKDGRVLVTGGCPASDSSNTCTALKSSEIYDPATGVWSPADELITARSHHTATLLRDGRVLVTGGGGGRSTDLYDPDDDEWTAGPDLNSARRLNRATLLEDGRVLVTGGAEDVVSGVPERRAELYDPDQNTWTYTSPSLNRLRRGHTATRLKDGRVLVIGGAYPDLTQPSDEQPPEIYDPGSDSWVETGRPADERGADHSATLLGTGKVLMVGGRLPDGDLVVARSAELFDPSAGGGTGTWSAADPLAFPRERHAAVLLPGGSVLIAGGNATSDARGPLARAELFDPAGGGWRSAGPMAGRRDPVPPAVVLGTDTGPCRAACGKVLVFGGDDAGSAELYTPAPSITAISPATGPAAGGTEVTVTGTGFSHSVREVRFGRAVLACPSAACTVDSYSKLRAVAPASATNASVPITVVNEGGAAESTDVFAYTGAATGGGGSITTSGTGGAQLGAPPSGASTGAGFAAQALRARAFRSCLVRAARHTRLDRAATRRGSLRARALARRHLRRHRSAMRRRCVARHGRTPGRVTSLGGRAISKRAIELSFRTPGTDRNRPPPARGYLIKQSRSPIRDSRDFGRAQTLCNGSCRLAPTRVGDTLRLTITDLRPNTTYYYAVAARDNVTRRLGPRSRTARARTR